jgi:ferric-dicitrate binding protein FerR (iron transport regulator)
MDNYIIDKTFRERIDKLSGLPPDVAWNREKGWNEYAEQYLSGRITGRKLFLYVSSAAAVIVLAILSVLVLQVAHYRTVTVSNNTDSIKEIVLPDSNRIFLNKDSFIEYPSRINEKHNSFLVSGETYFEFSYLKTPQYIIKAHNAVIIAERPCKLNIRDRMEEENVLVTVASGAIKIMEESNDEGLKLLVTEGNYCSVHKSQGLAYTSANSNNNYLAWKTGELIFNNTPIATVTDILAEYYNIEIEVEDKALAYCLFTGSFENQPIDRVLDRIRSELNFVIKISGNRISISRKV